MKAAPLLSLIAPPEGYRFREGLWITHDLNTGSLVELVLPTLAGVDVAEPASRQAAWSELDYNCLTVAYAADRAAFRLPVPSDVVDTIPVAGRRLHAKFLILRYEAESNLGLPKILTRAIVTSANLTRGGLTTNREVWSMRDTTSKTTRDPSLARDLLDAGAALAGDLAPPLRGALRERITSLRGPLRSAPRTKAITHSLSDSSHGSLLESIQKHRLRRLVIVSPPFASGDGADAVKAISPLLHPDLQLDLYFGTSLTSEAIAEGAPVGLLRSLAGQLDDKCRLTLYAVPGFEKHEGRLERRNLHAKAVLAFPKSGGVRMLLGSANLTGRGLSGKNRELMVEVAPGDNTAANNFIRELGGVRVELGQLVDPPAAADLPASVPSPPEVACIFRPASGANAGQTFVQGTLHLSGDLDSIRHLRLRGVELEVRPEQQISLPMDGPMLTAIRTGSSKQWELLVSIEAEEDFWDLSRIDSETEMRLPKDLRLLMTDLSRARRPRSGVGAPARVGDPGRFDLPYDRRLPDIVRMLPRLVMFDEDDLRDRLGDYLDDEVEREVALDLLDALRNGTEAADPSVAALQRLVALRGE